MRARMFLVTLGGICLTLKMLTMGDTVCIFNFESNWGVCYRLNKLS